MGTEIWAGLDPKYVSFANAYVRSGNLTECAEELEVSYKTVRTWSRMPAVAALISNMIQRQGDHSLLNRQLLERMALDIYDVAMAEEDTMGVDKDGMGYTKPIHNLPAANQSLALLHRISTDNEANKLKGANTGNVTIINIENANFNPNQHAAMLANQHKVIEHDG